MSLTKNSFSKTMNEIGRRLITTQTDFVATYGATGETRETFLKDGATILSGHIDAIMEKKTIRFLGVRVFQEYRPFHTVPTPAN